VPFALALALNKAAENTRELLVREWPLHVRARNPSYIRYALRRGPSATKASLRVEIFDQTGRGVLKRLDKGGTKQARGSNLAIPVEKNISVGAHGVRKSQMPRNLQNTFVADRGRGLAIYQRVGKGKRRRVKLMYLLRPSVQVPAKMPFEDDFVASMTAETRTSFPAAMARAMKSRRA